MSIIVPILSTFNAGGVDKATKSFADLEGVAAKSAYAIQKGFAPAVAALGGIGFAAKESIDAASNLSEQINKAGVVFAGSSQAIIEWSKTTADSFGISQRAALEAAGTFGNMLVPMGFMPAEAAKVSRRFVELAADMASFNNASPEETLAALRSGLAGESEPLRRFGVLLTDAKLKAEAMAMGLYSGKGALEGSAKAQATYSIILKETAAAQGDFGRTSDSLANQQRRLKATAEDTAAAFGSALLPIAQRLAGFLQGLGQIVRDNTKAFTIAIGVIGGVAAAIVVLNGVLKAYRVAAMAAAVAQLALSAAAAINPYVLLAGAVAALIGVLYHFASGNKTVVETLKDIGTVVVKVAGVVATAFALMAKAIIGKIVLIAKGVNLVAKAFDLLPGVNVSDKTGKALDFLKRMEVGVTNVMKVTWNWTKTADVSVLTDAYKGASDAVASLVNQTKQAANMPTIKLPNIPAGNIPRAGSGAGAGDGSKAADAAFSPLDSWWKRIKDSGEKATDLMREQAQKIADQANALRDRLSNSLGSAFGKFGTDALRAFDAETSRQSTAIQKKLKTTLDKLTADTDAKIKAVHTGLKQTLADIEAAGEQLTPAEQALAAAEALRDEERAARELAKAEQALADARKRNDAGDIAEAEQQLLDIRSERNLESLRAAARDERKQREKDLRDRRAEAEQGAQDQEDQIREAARIKAEAEQENADTLLRNLENERTTRRTYLERQLEDLEKSLQAHPGKYTAIHEKIMALFKDSFGPDFKTAGANLGTSFAEGLKASIGTVQSAALALANAGNPSNGLTGRGASATASASAPELNVVVNASLGSGPAIGGAIVTALQDWQRRNGALPLRVTGY